MPATWGALRGPVAVGLLFVVTALGSCGNDSDGGDASGTDKVATTTDVQDTSVSAQDTGGRATEDDIAIDAPQPKIGAERRACDPCSSSAQCYDAGSVCAGMGKPFGAAGYFCQLPCDPNHPCPEGSICDGTSTVEGTFTTACRPLSNFCGCSPKAKDKDWTTPCYAAAFDGNGERIGKCDGKWTCASGGAQCTAKKPTAEVCDGVDNDCDGQTDEGAPCDDDDPCTEAGSCVSGKCVAGKDACGCRKDADCSVADRCVATAVCDKAKLPWTCSSKPKEVVCDPTKNTACKVNSCDPKTGACALTAGKEGAGCDADGNPCTQADACKGGVCKAGPGKPCDDGNPCTFDACSAKAGAATCKHSNQTGACEDGNKCTAGDVCKGGVCKAGAAKACNDNNPCTQDACNPANGTCGHTPTKGDSCDDGDPCTAADTCSAGKCVGAGKAKCDDGNPCTADTCVKGKGCAAIAAAGACDDGNPCTAGDTCAKGSCVGGQNTCACQKNADCAAKQAANKCLGQLVCDTSAAKPSCKPKAGTAVVCKQDGNPCTTHVCQPKTGVCAAQAGANGTLCDDGDSCSVADTCNNGVCKGGAALGCNDHNPCTKDSCNGAGAGAKCSHVASAGACDDGDACTKNDACSAGQCQGGAKPACDDNNTCTTDACDPASGTCKHSATGSNNLVCTSGAGACGPAVCVAGTCKALSKSPCDDANPCTTDACVAGKGCSNKANTIACSDGNVCTVGDACSGGTCTGGKPKSCDDGNTCTLDKCSPAELASKGCVHTPDKAATCDDGDLCTSEDHCEGLKCVAKPKDCGDDEECTLDTCSKGKCSHDLNAKNGKKCKVHKWCWGYGTCGGGTCAEKAGTCPVKKYQQMWPIQFEPKLRKATTLFDPVGYHVVRLTVDADAWKAYIVDVQNVKKKKAKVWRKASVEFDGEAFKDIGIRPFGYGSQFYNPSKPNVRMKFDHYDDEAKGPYKRRNLRLKASGQDRTFLRQPLAQSLVQQAGGHAPRWSWARVFVNGEAYGLYQLFEQVDKRFFTANFGNNDGNDYEPSPICRGFNCPSGGCQKLKDYYKKDPGNGDEIVKLATITAKSPDATWAAEAGKVVDWQPLLAQYAIEAILSDFDSLAAAGNNYEIYVNEDTGKMQFIPGGMDLNFGRNKGWYDIYKPWGKPNGWCKGRVDHLYQRIIKTPALRKSLDATFKQLHCGAFSKAKQVEFIDKMRAMLADDLYNDPKGVASKSVIDHWYADMRSYVIKRDAYLASKFGPCK